MHNFAPGFSRGSGKQDIPEIAVEKAAHIIIKALL